MKKCKLHTDHELIRQDLTFWSLRQMLYLLRGEKLLAVVYFIFFLRIMQKLSNILHPSRQNWTTEVCIFLQKEDNSLKYLSQLLSHLLLYPGLSQWKLLSTPYIIPPWVVPYFVEVFILAISRNFTGEKTVKISWYEILKNNYPIG